MIFNYLNSIPAVIKFETKTNESSNGFIAKYRIDVDGRKTNSKQIKEMVSKLDAEESIKYKMNIVFESR